MTNFMDKAQYIMIGGFLGAGKTTTIGKYARHLRDAGHRVGLITNDQGMGLVDSALGRAGDFPVEEIAGGCFCCRFGTLLEAARTLADVPPEERPTVFLAEPVGSCTDLVATVSLPLQKIYGDQYRVSPLSVMVDPARAMRALGRDPDGKTFSQNVIYIYNKQLEEAEHIVINKTDTLSEETLATLRDALASEYPHAKIHAVSARQGTGLDSWFDEILTSEIDLPRLLEIDYDRYGEGEALLGWLNRTVEISSPSDAEFDGDSLLEALASALRDSLGTSGYEVAHLKMTLTPLGDPFAIAAVNLTRSDSEPELSHHLDEPLEDTAELLLNIRAEAPPEALDAAVEDALKTVLTARDLSGNTTHSEHFRPGYPTPTHRLTHAS